MVLTTFLAPLLSLMLLLLGSGFFMTFITVKLNASTYDFIEFLLGAIHASYYAGLILGSLKLESLIMRIGHIRAYAAFACLTTLSIILQAIFPSPYAWIPLRFIAGISFAGLYIAIESWLLSESDILSRGKILALYMGVFYCSQATGNFILDIVDKENLSGFLIAAGLCCSSTIPVCLTFKPSPLLHTVPPLKIKYCFQVSPYGFLGCFCAGLITSAIYAFLPDFAHDQNLSTSTIMFLTILGGFLLQWPIGILSDKLERRRILLFVSSITIVPCILAVFLHNHVLLYGLSFVMGGLCFVIYPISIAKVCDKIDQDKILSATSVLLLVYGCGSAIGPILVSAFIYIFSSSAIFIYIALICAALSLYGARALTKPSLTTEEQTDFVPLTNTTPIANEMDPRALPHDQNNDLEQSDIS